MAEQLPDSLFVGIDLSARQIELGESARAAAGLGNVKLHHMDLRDASGALGRFDFVIAHGLYSWIPEETRGQLLDLCAAVLAENGIALVSHNVKPGWFLRAAVREMMLWHTANIAEPEDRAGHARALLDFVAEATQSDHWRGVIVRERDNIAPLSDSSVFHDQLAEVNTGCWFHEMATELGRHGLEFLSDADFATMVPSGYGPKVAGTLDRLASNLVELEQYHDFVRGRAFRMTLSVHAGTAIDRHVKASRLEGLWVSSDARMREDGWFATSRGASGAPGQPAARALKLLGERHPQALSVDELITASGAEPGFTTDLLELYAVRMIELSQSPPRFTVTPGPRPRATPLARFQAQTGSLVTNRRHEPVRVDPARRALIPLLDGNRDRAALEREAGLAATELDEQLVALASLALLVA